MSDASILAVVQKNPEIGTSDEAYIQALITQAKIYIKEYCKLVRYPELEKGYAKSGATPDTDLTSLSTNWLYVSIDGTGFIQVDLTLANCTDGAATAAELQTQIRVKTDHLEFLDVVVEYDSTSGAEFYKITSDIYGTGSSVLISFSSSYKHVAKALKLSTLYGGTEFPGENEDTYLDSATVRLVEILYNRAGIEGMDSVSFIGGMSLLTKDMDPMLLSMLQTRRKLI